MPAGINDEVIEIVISQIIPGCFSLQLYIPRCYYIEYPDNDTTTPHHTIFHKMCIISAKLVKLMS